MTGDKCNIRSCSSPKLLEKRSFCEPDLQAEDEDSEDLVSVESDGPVELSCAKIEKIISSTYIVAEPISK